MRQFRTMCVGGPGSYSMSFIGSVSCVARPSLRNLSRRRSTCRNAFQHIQIRKSEQRGRFHDSSACLCILAPTAGLGYRRSPTLGERDSRRGSDPTAIKASLSLLGIQGSRCLGLSDSSELGSLRRKRNRLHVGAGTPAP